MNANLILEVGLIVLQTIGVILAVDFVSGIVHWLEDSYGSKKWPIIGKWIIEPNIRHHFEPRHFTKSNFWKRNAATLVLSGSVLAVISFLGWFHWTWALAALIGGVTNEIHCWAHRSPRENGKVITFLHKAKILQSPRGHATHHTDPKDRSYCTVTDWLNPLLDGVDFFARIEKFVLKTTGLKRRIDESVRPPKNKKKCCGGQCAQCAKCQLKKAA
ncbi:fatty acid desaturase CarF family protein [Roseibacillus persicicus]|uniref:fatty acid desaturase CarF family protein n=1 Tax=Roseibacillus persicicus TaxID=454148 RepID=UPI00280CB2FF|nr:fatty acid desaturase CarF family protein [Roseibacillus persicicus]MDQ8190914.1 fatty acid desaturase CarF family protein [Roseibacillus persicicus]